MVDQIGRDLAFMAAFRAEMARYRQLVRLSELPDDRLNLYSDEIKAEIKSFRTIKVGA